MISTLIQTQHFYLSIICNLSSKDFWELPALKFNTRPFMTRHQHVLLFLLMLLHCIDNTVECFTYPRLIGPKIIIIIIIMACFHKIELEKARGDKHIHIWRGQLYGKYREPLAGARHHRPSVTT